MRIESGVTSVSWTPAEQATRLPALPFAFHAPRFDDTPPPERLDDLDSLRAELPFCGANKLRAWIEVEDGRVVDSGYGRAAGSSGSVGSTWAKARSQCPPYRYRTCDSPRGSTATPSASCRRRAVKPAFRFCGAVAVGSFYGSSRQSSGPRSP